MSQAAAVMAPDNLSTRAPPARESKAKWSISPNTLHLVKCPCTRTRHYAFSTAEEYVGYQVDRFDKVWTRITHRDAIPAVLEAGERVARQLRAEGLELTHVAGYEVDRETAGTKRREISVLFLVPCPDEQKIRHRWVAEVLVHLNRLQGNIENVAIRYAADWEDWTISKPENYCRAHTDRDGGGEAAQEAPVEIVIPDKRELVSWDMVVDRLQFEVKTMLRGASMSSREFRGLVTRVTSELRRDGSRVAGFQVERVYRQSTKKKQEFNTRSPAIRIAFRVIAEIGRDDEETKRGAYALEPGAVVLIDYTPSSGTEKRGRVRGLAVVYQGEWPVFHHYRKTIPPPDLGSLLSMVKHGSKSGMGVNKD